MEKNNLRFVPDHLDDKFGNFVIEFTIFFPRKLIQRFIN